MSLQDDTLVPLAPLVADNNAPDNSGQELVTLHSSRNRHPSKRLIEEMN